ncbi:MULTISPECIES: (d)CMP kinase [Nosocomiicoccus]|uniref:(d)CMP kinase n=1 Tax=Nosocomiicoccus TaxID=489909 RepID=UPI0008A665BA|nr:MULTISPECIES: (d)CMP kinase [Nosocomiicoccus]MDK6862680.1 (d)CMP kinase [Nosocomiicoccus ampullae]OFO55454.1 cytidylate kinase [Nosocomiicoccus sp. HMSC059G07]
MSKINITIDGPAAAGKSTIAKIVANQLNYKYLDTGAMYRAVTLYSLNLSESLTESNITDAKINFSESGDVFLNDTNVTKDIRNSEVTNRVSSIASIDFVRDYLVDMQREIAADKGIVMDGRDIGTVVIPDAELKIYLTASPEIRAKRRLIEEEARGNNITLDNLIKEIIARDESDMNREHSPLKKAESAIEINTDNMTIDEVASAILNYARERINDNVL